MQTTFLNTEEKIFRIAMETFLRYGFHGTRLQLIAENANVNKSIIHYYFRSKERLYSKIVGRIIMLINSGDWTNEERDKKLAVKWFIQSEIYNNRGLFEKVIKEVYSDDWRDTIKNVLFNLEINKFDLLKKE